MSTHKAIDKICCVVLALTLLLTLVFVNAESFASPKTSTVMGYENRLFDTSRVHTINIIMDDWDDFTENCQSEEYYNCTVVIDNDAYKNVAIRAKGNTSLTQVAAYGNDRYSFKIEFDHYESGNTYYGLDKLCLNNIIQDNTYMKDYLCYQMMSSMGVASPLCSYVYITVNGEDWGLYLAVEGIEESFLERNYGAGYGELYKPDSQSMGGGRGNGANFDLDDFMNGKEKDFDFDADLDFGGDFDFSGAADFDGGSLNGSDDVLLKYIDDEISSYSNIFNNAKTAVSDSDKERLIASLKKLSAGEDLEQTVDIEKVIRYFVVHNFVLNFDSYTGSMIHNYYLYEADGQMQMIPWDYNLAFGGFESMNDATTLINYSIDDPISGGDVEDRPMIAWIFASEEYTELYHQYFAEFISEYFISGYFEEMMDEIKEMIAPYVEKDPTKFCSYEEFETGISTLKEFCLLRAESVQGQLDGTVGGVDGSQIDAGDLKVSDMGSMNNTMGGGMQKPEEGGQIMGGGMQRPEEGSQPMGGGMQRPEEGSQPMGGGMQRPEEGSQPMGGGMQKPEEGGQIMGDELQMPDRSNESIMSWIWLAVSVGAMAAGLVFAAKFRRRGGR